MFLVKLKVIRGWWVGWWVVGWVVYVKFKDRSEQIQSIGQYICLDLFIHLFFNTTVNKTYIKRESYPKIRLGTKDLDQ